MTELPWEFLHHLAQAHDSRNRPSPAIVNAVTHDFFEVAGRFGIDTDLRLAYFLASLVQSSDGFSVTEDTDQAGARFEGRRDLGNTQRGDGVRYKPRGFFWLLGRANYRAIGGLLGLPLEEHPERAGDPKIALRIAGATWQRRNLNRLADRDDAVALAKLIDGSAHGLNTAARRLRDYETEILRVLTAKNKKAIASRDTRGTPETPRRKSVVPVRPRRRSAKKAAARGTDAGTMLGVEGAAPTVGRRDTALVPPLKNEDADNVCYRVWYATNRKPVAGRDPRRVYSTARDSRVHHGYCDVCVPRSHKIGSLGSSWLTRLWTWTDDRLRLVATEELQDDIYWSSIAHALAPLKAADRVGLVFVHGYRVSFADAALRAAQIGVDLSIRGAIAFFSWPSQGTLQGYLADGTSIEASEDEIAQFLIDFASRSGASAVHIIAHSMGNRGVLRAVNRIAAQASRASGKLFGQIILAAADVDADVFRDLSAAYRAVCKRTTLYVSQRDQAIMASRRVNMFQRAGLTPPTLVIPGIDTVSVSAIDMSFLGHGYIAEIRDVLSDIQELLRYGKSPDHRNLLQRVANEDGEIFWEFRP